MVSAMMATDEGATTPGQSDRVCPLCGHTMTEHVIERSMLNTVLECPTDDRLPQRPDNGPVDEFGMPASAERLGKLARRH